MEFTFHQALFGYDGGHQLLAASLPFPSEARHFLGIATDLSGSAPARGFDHAYTGVPVPETHFYALFCTWLAPEMPRPGCVWSHVLLIDLADIAELSDFRELRKLFLRPLPVPRLEDFSHPIKFHNASHDHIGLTDYDKSLAEALLIALYEQVEMPVVLLAAQSTAHEDLVLAVWSQQWPRLRRNFRFSTGSFADRGRRGPAFDLQVSPESNTYTWHQDRTLVLTARDVKRPKSKIDSDRVWLHSVVQDLLYPDSLGFRTFLRTYGADVRALRAAFIPLARIHRLFSATNVEPWSVTLRTLAAEFPAPDEAKTLKLSSVSMSQSLEPETAERLVDSIDFLCHEDTAGAFAQVDVDFTKIIALLWPEQRKALMATLAKPPSSEIQWTALAQAVARKVSPNDITWLRDLYPELLIVFVRLHPQLATISELWRLPERSQWGVVEALEGSAVTQTLWPGIVHAMIAAGTTVGAREVTHCAGLAALDGAVDWLIEALSADLPPLLWREALRPLAEQRLMNEIAPLELAFCAALVPSTLASQLSSARGDLQKLASEPLENLPEPLRVPTAFLLLTVGLQASAKLGAPLIARGLFPVYQALEGTKEPPESWRLLQPHLPTLWYWQEWDRCEKLRRALVIWLRAHPNAVGTIREVAHKPAEKRLLESLGIPGF